MRCGLFDNEQASRYSQNHVSKKAPVVWKKKKFEIPNFKELTRWLKSTEPFLKVHKVQLPNGAKYICDFTWKFGTAPKQEACIFTSGWFWKCRQERKIVASDTELCFAMHPYVLFLKSYLLGYLHRARWSRGSLVTLGSRWALWDMVYWEGWQKGRQA